MLIHNYAERIAIEKKCNRPNDCVEMSLVRNVSVTVRLMMNAFMHSTSEKRETLLSLNEASLITLSTDNSPLKIDL